LFNVKYLEKIIGIVDCYNANIYELNKVAELM